MAPKTEKHTQPSPAEKPAPKHSNKFVYYGTIVIFVISALAFIVAPSLGNGSSSGDKFVFGTWNGKEIGYAQGGYFASQVEQVKSQLEAQGYSDTGDQFFAYQVWRRAFENTVLHTALLDFARSSGMAVSPSYLDKAMARNEAFQENGAFSRRRYRDASAAYKATIRTGILETTLKDRYVADAVSVVPSSAESAFIKAMGGSERIVEYVAFPFTAYPDSERLAYAQANPASFRRLSLSRITVTSSLKDAQVVLDRIRSGALSFEDAAKNHSKDAYATKGGDMGQRYAWELKGDFKDAASLDALLALPVGEISPVYETVAGSWVIFRVDTAVADPDYSSADLIRTVTEYLNAYEKGRIEDWVLAQAGEFAAAAAADFPGTAASRSLAVKETNAFPLNYGGAFNLGYFSLFGTLDATDKPELSGADSNEAFLTAAFSLQPGQVSQPIVHNNHALVLRVKEIRSAEESSLGLIDAYYPGVLQDSLGRDMADSILKSPSLKDNFLTTFSRIFASGN